MKLEKLDLQIIVEKKIFLQLQPISWTFVNRISSMTFALCIKAVHTSTCVVSWAAPIARYWLTYKTSESADVHHNRRTLVCRKDSC